MGVTRPSIIVPAYNEAACIERTLSVLTEGLETDSVEIVVVCNGCRDDTAARARDFRPPVRVMEREEASKVRALNAGERTVTGFPRVYLDADVELDGRSLQLLLDHASSPGALAAEPRPEFVTSSSTVWVRAYYSVWRDLHGRDAGRIGSGVVALSRAGRERFGEFPDVIADDGYVRRHFGPGELKYVDGARSRVHASTRRAASPTSSGSRSAVDSGPVSWQSEPTRRTSPSAPRGLASSRACSGCGPRAGRSCPSTSASPSGSVFRSARPRAPAVPSSGPGTIRAVRFDGDRLEGKPREVTAYLRLSSR